MNNKVLLAFIGGLLVASGITYFAMKRPDSSLAKGPEPLTITPATLTPAAAVAPAEPKAPETKPVESKAPEINREVSKPGITSRPSPVGTASRIDSKPITAEVPVPAKPSTLVNGEASRAMQSPEPPPPAPITIPQASEIARNPEPVPSPSAPPPVQPATVMIPAGTTLTVRMGETLSTERSRPGDTFAATLDQPLVVDGYVIAERGSRAQGRVVESDRSGKLKGVALMQIELIQLTTSDGQRVKLNTAFFEKKAESTRKQDAAKVGIGAALGAAIGAMAGGGKGAGIGAGVGGAAGAGDVALTRGKAVEFPVETRVAFRLAEPLTLTEKIR